MQFEVRALRHNTVTSVRVEALDADDARVQAAAQSLRPLSVRPLRRAFFSSAERGGVSLVLFSQELMALLEGGLTIVESVHVLREKETRPITAKLYGDIARGLDEGRSFSACLAQRPHVFSALYVGIIQSAEKTSTLTAALARFIDYQTRVDTLRNRIISASIYPAILSVVGLGVIAFLGTYVVPRFASIYQGGGRPLPAVSSWLLAWGEFAGTHSAGLAAGVLSFVVGGYALVRWLRSKNALAKFLPRVPFFARRVKIYEMTRLYLTLGMLLDGGLPITQALALSRGTVGATQQGAIDRATRDIVNGQSVSEAFDAADLTTPVARRFMRVGEQSGRLGEMLNRSARYHDEEVSRWIERFSRIFEPLLMASIGIVVGLIVVLLYMPIFDLAGSFQQ